MSKTSKKELLRRLEKVEKWIGEQTEVSVSGEKHSWLEKSETMTPKRLKDLAAQVLTSSSAPQFLDEVLETLLEKAVFEYSENGLVKIDYDPGQFLVDRDLVIFCVGENANGYSGFTLTPNPNYQIGEFRETWSKKAFDRITPEEASKKIRYEFLKPEEKP